MGQLYHDYRLESNVFEGLVESNLKSEPHTQIRIIMQKSHCAFKRCQCNAI